MSRLGGPNFHEIPVNAPVAAVHNNQRDGLHRQAIHRGRVAYEPNSLGGGCPFQAGMQGFTSVSQLTERADVTEDKVRGKPAKFADHYSQAQLFWRSQTAVEKRHIIAAFRFELSRVMVPAIRERVVSQLVNVDGQLARGVADGLGFDVPPAQPRTLAEPVHSEVQTSSALSLYARVGSARAAGRRVALLVVDGVDGDSLRQVYRRLLEEAAVPRFVGLRLGRVAAAGGGSIEVETTIEAMPSVLWDALVLPAGVDASGMLEAHPDVMDFVKDPYRHGKPILALGVMGRRVLEAVRLPRLLADGRPDPALVVADEDSIATEPLIEAFVAALSQPRLHDRELEVATLTAAALTAEDA